MAKLRSTTIYGDLNVTGLLSGELSTSSKASGFKLVMTDASGIIKQSDVAIGSSTTTFLRNDGT